jgi:hypothetical protein
MRWKLHVRFGERAGETGQPQCWHRAPARLHHRTAFRQKRSTPVKGCEAARRALERSYLASLNVVNDTTRISNHCAILGHVLHYDRRGSHLDIIPQSNVSKQDAIHTELYIISHNR